MRAHAALCTFLACAPSWGLPGRPLTDGGEPSAPGQGSTPGEPPNVVFLFVDDLGWTDLGCYGSSFYETPAIDGLAAEGVRFTQAYAAAPVCSPTRASVLAGKAPARLRNTDYFVGRRPGPLLPADYDPQLALEEETLAERMRDGGYRTGFFGKWHLGGEGFGPLEQGFERNVAGWRAGSPAGGYFAPWTNPALENGPDGEYLPERLTADALAFMEEVREEPFLLYLSYYNVHTPLQAKPERVEHYREKKRALGVAEEDLWGQERRRKVRLVQEHAVYAAMVEAVDRSVAAILARLEELELADETIVMLFSDNGGLSTSEGHPTSNLPLRAGKGWLYEGGIREPLIVRGPGIRRGVTDHTPVISNDLAPTLLELCGLPAAPRQHLDGMSLAGLLREGTALANRPLHWHYPHYGNQGGAPSGAIRVGDLKLIEWYEDGRLELFDLARDPGEQRDLARAQPAQAAALAARLQGWREGVGALMPRPNPNPVEAR
jgi:arylsulfatase A-like enzyme